MPHILVLGLGNPLLGDDGVGWRVAEDVRPLLDERDVEVDCSDLAGLSLMERIAGYRRVVLIDSWATDQPEPGKVCCFRLSELADPAAGHTTSAHDMTLGTALTLGSSLGMDLADPEVITIEVQRSYEVHGELTPPVESSVPEAVRRVLDLLPNMARQSQPG